ncbi:MAG: porphobilinogen synthase [Nitrospinota bacterium]|nr:porphobilinogen synthase [Nitrospinota bacterium]MDH5757676.1 porphobilinogen synthase [Nitrospinota bacterium]
MEFPQYRPRRLRASANIRRMVRETRLRPDMFIYPLFVHHGQGVKEEIGSMPGNFRLSVDNLAAEVQAAQSLGIPGVILFGIPEHKDEMGSEAYNPDGIIQRAIKEIKNAAPEMVVITDVCIDEFTSHGHCGVVDKASGEILNDPTLDLLAKMALTHADCGADMVAPSDMMDGRIGAVREALDDSGHGDVAIMSYAAKYASGYYGPFRDACDSAPQFGDRSTYQMDPANAREAVREVTQDILENADIIMVKPALPYLDIIRMIRDRFDHPLAAYNVSGEYAMIEAAGRNGWIDRDRVMLETLLSIHRAGADMILTYFAKDAARLLNG